MDDNSPSSWSTSGKNKCVKLTHWNGSALQGLISVSEITQAARLSNGKKKCVKPTNWNGPAVQNSNSAAETEKAARLLPGREPCKTH